MRRLGIVAVGLALVVGITLGLGPEGTTAQLLWHPRLAAPGGISALPSGGAAIPGVTDQTLPAIIRAHGPGNHAVVTAFCDPMGKAPAPRGLLLDFPLFCATESNPPFPPDTSGAITFEITRLYPPDGPAASTFTATGTDTLVCADNADCDLSSTPKPSSFNLFPGTDVGVVAVQLDGGGANEIIEVRATDELGDSQSVQIAVVDTIMAFGPAGPPSVPSQGAVTVAYACDDVGQQPASPESEVEYVRRPSIPYESADADLDGVVGLDDLWDLLYGFGSTFGYGLLDNNLVGDIDLPLYWCGGDTPSTLDDSVTFETDLGLFSISALAQAAVDNSAAAARFAMLLPTFFDPACDEGQSAEATDVDSLSVWANALPTPLSLYGPPPPQEGGCDLDFAPNGVVSYVLRGNGQVGAATVSAQQGGGAGAQRSVNVTFIMDTDADGMPDSYEMAHSLCLNPVVHDAAADPDGDWLDNIREYDIGTEPCVNDTDRDGCADGEELGPNPVLGGTRDPLNPYDFFDVPVPTAFNGGTLENRDKAVSILNDVLGVLEYAGTSDGGDCNGGPDRISGTGDDRCYNQDKNSDGEDDGILYDRSVSGGWSGPPNGAITLIEDVLLALAQANTNCQASP